MSKTLLNKLPDEIIRKIYSYIYDDVLQEIRDTIANDICNNSDNDSDIDDNDYYFEWKNRPRCYKYSHYTRIVRNDYNKYSKNSSKQYIRNFKQTKCFICKTIMDDIYLDDYGHCNQCCDKDIQIYSNNFIGSEGEWSDVEDFE
jgi:hypothetical protein